MLNIPSINKLTVDISKERIDALRSLIPEAFTEGRLDFNKLRQALGDIVDDSPERYSFTWWGKKDAIRACQTPTSLTLVPCANESINWDSTQHVFIEGDNLDALKLLYKAYFGKAKVVYIDPPYNTGHEFIYLDNYRNLINDYHQHTEQIDESGNIKSSSGERSGRYHSRWLSMMYPRLFFARQLLREDGVIFISIDDNEVHNLRLLCNEIFGEENFVSTFVWNSSTAGGIRPKHVSQCHEYALMYAKSKESLGELIAPLSPEAVKQYGKSDNQGVYREKDFAWRNPSKNENQIYGITAPDGSTLYPSKGYIYRFVQESFEQAQKDGLVVFKKTDTSPLVDQEGKKAKFNIYIKKYLGNAEGAPASIPPRGIVGLSSRGSEEVKSLFEDVLVFTNPKSTDYLSYLLKVGLEDSEDSLIVDFFAGSGTTAHTILKLNQEDGGNRKFILVQYPEATGRQDYTTISDITKERLRRVINSQAQAVSEQDNLTAYDYGFRVFKLAPSHFRDWAGVENLTPEQYLIQMEGFGDPLFGNFDAYEVVWEVAVKEGFSLSSQVESAVIQGHAIYRVTDINADRLCHICLDGKVSIGVVNALQLSQSDLFICRDIAIDDSIAANLALNCRLKTI